MFEDPRILTSIVMSSISLLGMIVGGAIAWTKLTNRVESVCKTLEGYVRNDGSSIFRKEVDCDVIHQDLVDHTCRKIDDVKSSVDSSASDAQRVRDQLKKDIRKNRDDVQAMFLEIKEFMGNTKASLDHLKRRLEEGR